MAPVQPAHPQSTRMRFAAVHAASPSHIDWDRHISPASGLPAPLAATHTPLAPPTWAIPHESAPPNRATTPDSRCTLEKSPPASEIRPTSEFLCGYATANAQSASLAYAH